MISRKISGEEYRAQSSSSCSLLYFPFTSSFLGPSILLKTLLLTHPESMFLRQCVRPSSAPIQNNTRNQWRYDRSHNPPAHLRYGSGLMECSAILPGKELPTFRHYTPPKRWQLLPSQYGALSRPNRHQSESPKFNRPQLYSVKLYYNIILTSTSRSIKLSFLQISPQTVQIIGSNRERSSSVSTGN